MNIINFYEIEGAPFDKPILLLFPGNIVHTGIKKISKWVKYPGKENEEKGESIVFEPIGISATYSSNPYFAPIGLSATYSSEASFEKEPIGYLLLDKL